MGYMGTEYGVIIGRFQVFKLDQSHIDIIEAVRANHTHVVVLLGVSPIRGRRHPLNIKARKQMIQERFPDVEIRKLNDARFDAKWVQNIEEALQDFPAGSITLYSNSPSIYVNHGGKWPIFPLQQQEHVESESERMEAAERITHTEEFRAGVIYGISSQWNRAILTVDVAVVKPSRDGIFCLLVRKPNEPLFRFPGGYVDPADKIIEEAGVREVLEETQCVANNLKYLGSLQVDDWRYRFEPDKIMTVFYIASYVNGDPAPTDDIEDGEVKWFHISELTPGKVMEEHRPLLGLLIKEIDRPVCNVLP